MELGSNKELAVQGEPNEGADLARVGVVPNSSQHLGNCWVVGVELLDEGADNRDLERSPCVPITSLSRVPKEGQVPQWGGPLPVPFSQILREAFDEAGLKYPKKIKFGEHRKFSNHFEGGFMLFLGKDFDQVVAFE